MRSLVRVRASRWRQRDRARARAVDAGAAAESFAGKTVTISVPVAPGGAMTPARAWWRVIRKHLPGQPAVSVKRMPGAGGIILAGHLYTTAPKDGTEFAVLQDANLFQQLTTNQQLPYDARKFGYLGALEKFVPIVLAWHTTQFRTFDYTKRDPMTLVSVRPGSPTDYFRCCTHASASN